MMRLLQSLLIAVVVSSVACGTVKQQKLARMTQENLSLDLGTGDLFLNGSPIDHEGLRERLSEAFSISFSACAYTAGEFDVSSRGLLNVLNAIDQAGVAPKFVSLDFYYFGQNKPDGCNFVEFQPNGAVVLNGEKTQEEELLKKLQSGGSLSIKCEPTDFQQVLAVLTAAGPTVDLINLQCRNRTQIEIEVEIYQMGTDGIKEILSSSSLTTRPGNEAMLRIVENATGRKTYPPGTDTYHQEDLANLGTRFSVVPQVIGDHLRVSGAVILTKSAGRKKQAFVEDGIPIYSYSSAKTVVPFSKIFPPNVDSLEFPVSDMKGQETFCRLSVAIVDAHGKTLKDRALLKGE